jgi:dTDP-glucose 4,6-dehydratase/UDP-glucose 4-epimerase
MSTKTYLVTGGTGFLGSGIVRRLLAKGHAVRVLDDDSRGAPRRLADVAGSCETIKADVRDAAAVAKAARGVDGVYHLAYVNGTEFFYSMPELVLDVAVKGMSSVLDACRANGVRELILASSSEVYQTPPRVPTDESVPLVVPDPLNPRYSYSGGKIACELMALNHGRRNFDRVLIFRPHNVYGPDMGWEHVLPQFALRLAALHAAQPEGPIRFPIQGDGTATRSFNYIEDFLDGVMLLAERGEHLGIYHVGASEEVTIAAAAKLVAECFGREVELVPGLRPAGGTLRRCPDISKLAALGYAPKVPLREGLPRLVAWYRANARFAPKAKA